ncbi:MAG: HAMP domain-containing protein [Ignavibacteriae bacterium]|nr:HAMP domain-containing protein [Ignavibacteriota bacterium]
MKAHTVAELLEGVLEHLMLEGKSHRLKQTLEAVTNSSDIKDACILKPDGTVSLSAKTGEENIKIPLDQFRKKGSTLGEMYMSARENDSLYEYVIIPIAKKPECWNCHQQLEPQRGFFAIKISMDDLRAVALQHRSINIVMSILMFTGLGGIIYLALSVLVIKPIKRLHSYIRKIEGGVKQLENGEKIDFPLLPESKTVDEIADLCRDINNLVRRLNESNKKLIEVHRIQLEQADRLATTGEMAASIAHEIKNPLAGVLGALQVFDSKIPSEDSRKEILSEMMMQLERINRAVSDLLSYARPLPPQFEAVNLHDLIQKTTPLFSHQLNGTSITIDYHEPDEQLTVYADCKQLQQVLWNVMLNSIQAMDQSGTLFVRTSKENGSIRLVISDSGRGMPVEVLSQVFKPFFTTKHKGTGLGMTITKYIVEQHQGSITVSSELGKGTIITILLPQFQNP